MRLHALRFLLRPFSFISAAVLTLALFQTVAVSQSAQAASGTVTQGTCSSVVGETTTAVMLSTSGKCVIKFTAGTNSWTVPAGVTSINYLIVGGGGAGSHDGGGGGAGGGAYTGSLAVNAGDTGSVTVGAGGVAGTWGANVPQPGNSSSLIFGSVTLQGAGGTAGTTAHPGPSAEAAGGSGSGTGNTGISYVGGAGGAGAGWISGSSRAGGAGHQGTLTSSISGSSSIYGGGGGGGAMNTGAVGAGGLGGGGTGGYSSANATAGVANTGGGGGGGQSSVGTRNAANGGSGVVFISFVNPSGNYCSPLNQAVTSGPNTYTVLTFSSIGSCNWKVPTGVSSVEYLVVGGGGGGGSNRGGGGGAGGLLTGTTSVTAQTDILITVGAGGAGGPGASGNWNVGNLPVRGSNGENSQFGSNLIAYGGGAGGRSFTSCGTSGSPVVRGGDGGSGGGAGIFATSLGAAGEVGCSGGAAVSLQGNAGGGSGSPSASLGTSGLNYDLVRNTGGGGGAGSAGIAGQGGTRMRDSATVAGVTSRAPDGGAGLSSSITGQTVYYAGGGGGAFGNFAYLSEYAQYFSAGAGAGGQGGGGAGSGYIGTAGVSGTPNTGGGGGGGGMSQSGSVYTSLSGGSGGSGVVIVRYLLTHSITFNANTGVGSMTAQTVADGVSSPIAVNTFTKASNLFTGWNTNADGSGTGYGNLASVTLSTDLVLYAQWSSTPAYIVSYDGNAPAGQASGVPAVQLKTYGSAVTLSASLPTRTGYQFSGWYTTASGSGGTAYSASGTLAANDNFAVTLYAQWAPDTYSIVYDGAGGADVVTNVPSSQAKTYGQSILLSAGRPTRTGYTFLGWNTNSGGTGTAYRSSQQYSTESALTLYAQWTPTVYTVAYVANGGSPEQSLATSEDYASGTQTQVKSNNAGFARTGYTFGGWSTNSNGTGTILSPGDALTVSNDTILYAKWEAVSSPISPAVNASESIAHTGRDVAAISGLALLMIAAGISLKVIRRRAN